MLYPTIEVKETNNRHIVKDRQYCECGLKYNFYSTVVKKDLKKIKFKFVEEITCLKCKSIIQ